MSSLRLTPPSYIVLGLLSELGEATPYTLKQLAANGIGNLWSLQHAQLYRETERLADAGYLTERRESEGRRRKLYRVTDEGRRALAEWLATPTAEYTELRDLALLKLALGTDPATIAPVQLELHRNKLREYEQLRALSGKVEDLPPEARGAVLALEAGIGHEREYVRFWSRLAKERGAAN
ncbi:MAG: hypothetical protein QOJ38_860 [Solirubrobacterales bacterium]|jgi:DNA-binding PadR family transcriptional regulator|nr:hypothetical protein [Solirubrobacterales bacterium]